jgi:hypothetical protein
MKTIMTSKKDILIWTLISVGLVLAVWGGWIAYVVNK